MQRLNFMDWLASILAAVGGIQLALVGFFNYDLLSKVFTADGWYRTVTAIIAVAVLYLVGDVWVRVTGYTTNHVSA